MINLIVDISRYLMSLLIALYTYWNFRYFRAGKDRQEQIYHRLNRLMFLLHFLAFAIMFLKTENRKLPVFYGAQAVFFLCFLFLYGKSYPRRSAILAGNLCFLLSIGFTILTRLSFDKAVRQFAIVVFSAMVTWVIPIVINRFWQLSQIPWFYGIGGMALLGAVCVAGDSSFGARLSLSFGEISIQPLEFVKISFVFFVAAMFYQSTNRRKVAVTTAAAGGHVLILALSKDLGSALIFFITYFFMLFVATSSWKYFSFGIISGIAASISAWKLFSHVRVRIEAWRNPWIDIDGKGYQITQSLFAIGTGGWFGSGLYQGMPKKIPVVEKDFIFSAVSEEMGALFAFCVVLICLGCFLQFMQIACEMKALFYKLIAVGLGTVYIVQVFLTVGGAVKLIPSTGVTLPFISYGGSSVLGTFVMFSVIQGLYILKRSEEDENGF